MYLWGYVPHSTVLYPSDGQKLYIRTIIRLFSFRLLVRTTMITIMPSVLQVLLIAYYLGTSSSYALTITIPSNGSNSTGGPVPSDCQRVCAPIVPFAIDGQSCTPQTCCSAEWEAKYYACIVCAAGVQDITDLSTAQATLDGIHEDCAASGITIPLLTFPGQSDHRTLPSPSILPSSVPSGTGTGTATGTATSTSVSGNPTASASTTSSATPTHSASAASSVQIQWAALISCSALAIFSFLA